MDKKEVSVLKSKFDELVHVDKNTGIEFWYARELQPAFSYSQWRRFSEVIEKAKHVKSVVILLITILPTSAKWSI